MQPELKLKVCLPAYNEINAVDIDFYTRVGDVKILFYDSFKIIYRILKVRFLPE